MSGLIFLFYEEKKTLLFLLFPSYLAPALKELRASNDDRTDRDLQLDGGGISDQPVIIAVHPLAQVGGFGG